MLMPPQPPRGMKYAPALIIPKPWLLDLEVRFTLTGLNAGFIVLDLLAGKYRLALLGILCTVYLGLGIYQTIQRTQRLTMEIINGRGS